MSDLTKEFKELRNIKYPEISDEDFNVIFESIKNINYDFVNINRRRNQPIGNDLSPLLNGIWIEPISRINTTLWITKLTFEHHKKIIDWCSEHPETNFNISKLIAIYLSYDFSSLIRDSLVDKKTASKILDYFMSKVLPIKSLTEPVKLKIFHLLFDVYDNNSYPYIFKIIKKYKDDISFHDIDLLKLYVRLLVSHGLQYKDYNGNYLINVFIEELSKGINKGKIINPDDFKIDDNLEEYLAK